MEKENAYENPNMEMMELNVFGIWAYDSIWALARAVEKVVDKIFKTKEQNAALNMIDLANIGASQSGSIILNELLQIRFRGLSGEFQFMHGKLISRAFEIVNVLGKWERKVGFWTVTDGITNEMNPSVSEKYPRYSSTNTGLETIIWPGGSTTTPKGWLMRMNGKKLRIGVPMNQGFEELIKVQRNPQTNATTATGFCIDVFNAAIDGLLNTESYKFIPFEDSNGEPAGNYNDLVYQVYLQHYDVVVGDTTITANRSLYVDFTVPYTDLALGTIAKVDNKNMWIFLKPLDSNLWLRSAAFFILTGFVVWVIEHPVNEKFQGYQSGSLVKGDIVSNLNFEDTKLMQYSSPKEYADALSRGTKNGGVVAIIDEIPYIKIFLAKYSQDYTMIAYESKTNALA
ncbi:glutamate receptor 2.1-like [Cornus florida]|uniref:glutamate receptor 2.1-like n=1 Tax=Cornus florida TaxID=4283 RepID=UPI0028A04D35|nr:glutamate receptor 2.1-like [Cornus florida]